MVLSQFSGTGTGAGAATGGGAATGRGAGGGAATGSRGACILNARWWRFLVEGGGAGGRKLVRVI